MHSLRWIGVRVSTLLRARPFQKSRRAKGASADTCAPEGHGK